LTCSMFPVPSPLFTAGPPLQNSQFSTKNLRVFGKINSDRSGRGMNEEIS
jgi:hypothetical protein